MMNLLTERARAKLESFLKLLLGLGALSANPLIAADSAPEVEPLQGKYRLEIGVGKPSFSSDLKYYKELYGDPELYPVVSLDRIFWSWFGTLGVGARMGYYKESGKAAVKKGDSFEADENSKVDFTLLPMQLVGTMHLVPFPARWIMVNLWGGLEWLYAQEVRVLDDANATSDSSTGSDRPYINKGFSRGFTLGASLGIRIDALDRSSTNSLKGIGLRSVYIAPFYELARNDHKLGPLHRNTLGLSFIFESMY